MATFKIQECKGIIPAMLTCFDENQNVDVERTKNFTEFLIGKNINGLYLTGSTGEGFLMTSEERNLVVKTVCEQVKGRIPVIAHIGECSTKKAIDLAKYAEECGCDAISSVPPYYYGYKPDNVYNYYVDIANSVNIPMVIYNNCNMSESMLTKLAEHPNIQGMKFTSREHDLMNILKKKFGKDFMIYSGCDEMGMQGLLANADGLIGSFYNMIPETYLEIYKRFKNGELLKAFNIQEIATELIRFFVKYDFMPLMRECLRQKGLVDAGYSRKPFKQPTAKDMEEVWSFCANLKASHDITYMDFLDKSK